MKKIYLTIFSVFIASIVLSGCTDQPDKEYIDADTQAKVDQIRVVALDEVMDELSDEVGVLEGPMRTSFRKNVDSYMSSGDGMGFYARLTENDPIIESELKEVDEVMKEFGFKREEGKPKNDSSPIISFVRYELGEILCTIEVIKIGSTTNNDVILGCE